MEELFTLLRGVIFPDLLERYQQIAGVNAPELPAESIYREVFLALATLNADPDALPKSILFVEHLASGRRSGLAIELRRWADRQTSKNLDGYCDAHTVAKLLPDTCRHRYVEVS